MTLLRRVSQVYVKLRRSISRRSVDSQDDDFADNLPEYLVNEKFQTIPDFDPGASYVGSVYVPIRPDQRVKTEGYSQWSYDAGDF